MSNLPPNPYNNSLPGVPPINVNTGQVFNHNQQFSQLPPSQVPPGCGLKDANSNSPLHRQQNSVNSLNQSGSSSPAFNQPGLVTSQPSPIKHMPPKPPNITQPASPVISNPSPTSYPPNYQSQHQINDNAPPLIPSSQYQPLVNGPLGNQHTGFSKPPTNPSDSSTSLSGQPANLFGSTSSHSSPQQYPIYSSYQPMGNRPPVSTPGFGPPPSNYGHPPLLRPPGSQPPVSTIAQLNLQSATSSGPIRNSPLPSGPPSGAQFSGPNNQPLKYLGMNGPNIGPQSQGIMRPPLGPSNVPGPAVSGISPMGQPSGLVAPPSGPMGQQSGRMGLPMGPKPPGSGTQMLPPISAPPLQTYPGSQNVPPTSQQFSSPGLAGPIGIKGQNLPPQPSMPPMNQSMGPPSGPVQAGQPSNLQSRYPQMPNYNNQQGLGKQYPQQYNTQGLTQQMGQLSVTKQGFDQLWGHHMIDLLQCKHILPEYPEDPPEIKLGHQFAESPNCSHE